MVCNQLMAKLGGLCPIRRDALKRLANKKPAGSTDGINNAMRANTRATVPDMRWVGFCS